MKMKAARGKLAVGTNLPMPPGLMAAVSSAHRRAAVLRSLKRLVGFVQGVSSVVPTSLVNMGVCLGVSLLC